MSWFDNHLQIEIMITYDVIFGVTPGGKSWWCCSSVVNATSLLD